MEAKGDACLRRAPAIARSGAALAAFLLVAAVLGSLASPPRAAADLRAEEIGRVEKLTLPPSPHWVWVSDFVLRRLALVDLDSERLLGIVDAGYWLAQPLFPISGSEFYVVETHYSRTSRGERTDVLAIYDTATLSPQAEVVIPPKRALSALVVANAALSDDERFAAVHNMTPATSLSIVDLERRRFAAEIATPGCALAYGAGPRRFAMLCGDGALLLVALDPAGRERSRLRSPPFFDPERDPVTEKAVRYGQQWLFVSFEGWVHAVDVSGEEPRFLPPWSLFDDEERAEQWRIGGSQHLALHEPTGRLYSLVHRGGRDTHKDPGHEVWVYDLSTHRRVQRIELRSPGVSILGAPLQIGRGWLPPFDRLAAWLQDQLVDPGLDAIQVTQDARPRLAAISLQLGGVNHYDALSGDFIGRAHSGNISNAGLEAPFGRAARAGAVP